VFRRVISAIIAIVMVTPLFSCDPRRDLTKKEIEKYLDMAIEQIYAMDFEKDQDEQVAALLEILEQRDSLEKTGMAVYNDMNWIDLHLTKEQCKRMEYFSECDKVIIAISFSISIGACG